MKKKTEYRNANNLYEYAFSPVPVSKRKGTFQLFTVLTGYAAALSCFAIGAEIGYALSFYKAVLACLLGSCILLFTGGCMGAAGCRTGLSAAFLSNRIVGRTASGFFSILIVLAGIYWIGMNGNAFARMILTVFPECPLPVSVMAVFIIFLWSFSASFGWTGIQWVSRIAVPVVTVFVICGIAYIGIRTEGFSFIEEFVPSGRLTFSMAVTAVAGNYTLGCVLSPDMCRFAGAEKKVLAAQVPAYMIGLVVFTVSGILVGQAGNSPDFSVGAIRLGIRAPMLIGALLCLWATGGSNIYGASLATQSFFRGTAVEGNLSYKNIALIVTGLAAAYAAVGALDALFAMVTLIAVLLLPVAGMMIGEYLFFGVDADKKKKEVSRLAIPIWILGSLTGYAAVKADFFLPPVIALSVSLTAWVAVGKLWERCPDYRS